MIEYVDHADGVEPSQLEGFFEGWPDSPTPDTHVRILRGSDYVVLARRSETGRVVGFVTAISDGVLAAYIPLLEVLPDHRGQGIGAELVTRVMKRLEGHYMIDLVCDPPLQPFYERLGLRPMVAMGVRDYASQAGGLLLHGEKA
jgi:ribosomal protein S18 acetylase RimI-like enzyme